MVGLIRLYIYRNGVQDVRDVPLREAKEARLRLLAEGWTVYHSQES